MRVSLNPSRPEWPTRRTCCCYWFTPAKGSELTQQRSLCCLHGYTTVAGSITWLIWVFPGHLSFSVNCLLWHQFLLRVLSIVLNSGLVRLQGLRTGFLWTQSFRQSQISRFQNLLTRRASRQTRAHAPSLLLCLEQVSKWHSFLHRL